MTARHPAAPPAAPAPSAAAAAEVDSALLRMAYERLRPSVLMTLGVCVVFVGLFWPLFPVVRNLAWLALMLGVAVARYGLWWVHARAAADPARDPHWRRLFTAGAVAAGLAWAFGPVMLMPEAGRTESMLLVLTLMAVSAVSMQAMGALPRAMLGFQLAALGPTALALVVTGGLVERLTAAVLLAAMLSLMLVGRGSSAALRALLETEQRLSRAVQETTAAGHQAQAASLAKSRFLANMSHELRTPLNAVIGAAQLMKSGERDAERRAHLVEAIERSGTNLLGLVENILDLSRIEAGELQLMPADFHLVDCIDTALATTALAARAKALRLACVVEPGLPAWRHGDAARLRQVLLNLLGNAVKFTEQGEVVLRVARGAGPDDLRLSVADTGIGIAAASLAQVFEPFRQADEGADRRFGGSGLGLAIVRQLVEAMGGRVAVHSVPGQGTRFDLALPLPAAARLPAPPAPLHLRVAYFEPHEAGAEALQALLLRLGCMPQRVHDGAGLRAWCAEVADQRRTAWLLVCTDDPRAPDLLEQAADGLDAQRVIGMSAIEAPDAERARAHCHLPGQLMKPVLRTALVSRFGAGWRPAAPPVADPVPLPLMTAGQLQALTHVLVVEDDPLNQTIICRLLGHAGYRVSAVSDGLSALAAVREQAVDLVLMDWQMPDIDGVEVTRRLRAGAAGEAGRQVPIVALTANAFAEDRATCLAAGMNDFLTKPVLAASLVAAIQRWARPAASPAAAGPAAGPADAGPVVYDPAVLAALPMVADGTQPGYAGEVLDLFAASLAPALAAIRDAAAQGDGKTLQRALHTLKSSSATVGAQALAAQAAQAETALRSGQAVAADLADRLQAAADRLLRALGRPAAAEPAREAAL